MGPRKCSYDRYGYMKTGVFNLENDIDYLVSQFDYYLNTGEKKYRGHNNRNLYIHITSDLHDLLEQELTSAVGEHLYWNFDFFKSYIPVTLHNDYFVRRESEVIVGVIIPLYWSCKQPYTLMFNKFSDEKCIYFDGMMRHHETGQPWPGQKTWPFTSPNVSKDIVKHIPKGTMYYKHFRDIELTEEYKWTTGTGFLFDTKQWHSSSWFVDGRHVDDNDDQFKLSIVGFGARKL